MRTLPGIVIAIACAGVLAGCNSGARESQFGGIEVGNCYVGGCSGEICSDKEDVPSLCIYKPEYACYRTAVCEPQQDASCGWTQSAELQACLAAGGP